MTAEELQDQALDNLIDARAKQRADRVILAAKVAVQAQRQAARDAAWAAYQATIEPLNTAGWDAYLSKNVAEGEDVVAISRAAQAYQEAMQNHGFVNG